MNDWIELEDMALPCIVGVLESEQRAPQTLEIGLRLGVSLEQAGEGDALHRSVDYAAVVDQVEMLVQHGRWRLLETLGLALCRMLLAAPTPAEQRAEVERVDLTLRKPEILAGRAVPGVRMARTAAWCALRSLDLGEGVQAEVLVEAGQSGAWRVRMDPGSRWQPPAGVALQVLAGTVQGGGERWGAGGRFPRQWAGSLQAPSDATLLAVGTPPLGTAS